MAPAETPNWTPSAHNQQEGLTPCCGGPNSDPDNNPLWIADCQECTDGLDNDGDGLIDCDESACVTRSTEGLGFTCP